jgi:predicted ATPase
VAIEDLHWSDQTSEEYLTSLVEHLPGAPVLLLCTYRPGYRPPWMEKSYATQVALQPLTPQDSLGVVQAVCQTAPLPSPLAEVILRQAEGNPLFLEELTHAMVERGDGHSTVAVPDTLEGVLLARIDRLPESPKQLLQAAAVLGRDVSPRLLRALWDGPEDLEVQLQELQRLELLYAHMGTEEPSYRFKHALTQEVAYGSLLHERRRELHARIVDAIEALHLDQLGGEIERLAYHALRGELGEKAVHYLRQAGLKAATR